MEVANFCVAMDTLIDQDAERHTVKRLYLACPAHLANLSVWDLNTKLLGTAKRLFVSKSLRL